MSTIIYVEAWATSATFLILVVKEPIRAGQTTGSRPSFFIPQDHDINQY